MAFITGNNEIVLELVRKMGIDPNICGGMTIHLHPGEMVTADVEILVDREAMEFVVKRFLFVDDGSVSEIDDTGVEDA